MLLLAYVDGDVFLLRTFTNDHSLVNRSLYADEHDAAILCVVETVGRSLAFLACHQRSGKARGDLALVRLIPVKERVDDAFAARIGHEIAPIPEQTTGRDGVFDAHTGAGRGDTHFQ